MSRSISASNLDILITAEEAYPEMERCFLDAEAEIVAGYRIFNLDTRLRSDSARKIGDTWFDLIVHTLQRGIRLRFVISDFDPIVGMELHAGTWRTMRQFAAAREIAGPGADLEIRCSIHAARVGFLGRILFWPGLYGKLKRHAETLNGMPSHEQENQLRDLPGLKTWLVKKPAGLRAARWPMPSPAPATHHQKLAVFDNKALLIGGLDLDERRFDTKTHDRPAEQTWHDVQLLIRAPDLAAEARDHLLQFRAVIAGLEKPRRYARFLTTVSSRRKISLPFIGPLTRSQDIAYSQTKLAQGSKRLIYIETQYFRDRRLARKIAWTARRNPELCMILILPAAPEVVAFGSDPGTDAKLGEYLQARCLRKLRGAFGPRLLIGAPVQPVHQDSYSRVTLGAAPLVYVHAKVSIFDQSHAIVSSANLNGRSLSWDTEAGVLLDSPEAVEKLRKRLFCHWLPQDAGPEFFNLETAFTTWRDLVEKNARKTPSDRRGFIMPYDIRPAEELGSPLPIVPDEMV